MTNRNITGSLLTAVQKTAVVYYELVKIDIAPTTYLTNAPFPIVYNDGSGSATYHPRGSLLSFDSVEENVNFEIPDLNIELSGLNQYDNNNVSFATALQSANYIEREVTISRVYFDHDATQIGTFLIYEGRVQGISMSSDNQTVTCRIETSSHWSDFDRENGRYTNDNSHQKLFSGDRGFEYASEVQKEIEWKAQA